jgi:alpha-D-xyloside xylohydrolase
VEEQLQKLTDTQYPATALVVEAWSDEATFYIWNGADYDEKRAKRRFPFRFSVSGALARPFEDDRTDACRGREACALANPRVKQLEEGENCPQHERDDAYAVEDGLSCAMRTARRTGFRGSGSSVRMCRISPRRSFVPGGWRNAATCWKWVDGFKTDGGEFIHDLSVSVS